MCAAQNEPRDQADVGDRSLMATERQLCRLEELAEIGMELARALGRHVARATEAAADATVRNGTAACGAAAGGPFAGIDPALAYSRIARAVRQIVALEQQTLGLRETRTTTLQTERRRDRIQAVRRAVKERIEAEHPDIERSELGSLLHDLFLDYADYDDGDEDGEALAVARIMRALQTELDEIEGETIPFDEPAADERGPMDADRDPPEETGAGWDAPRPPPWRWPGSPHLRANGHDPP